MRQTDKGVSGLMISINKNLKVIPAYDQMSIKENNLEIIFLGTNGWYDTETGNTICILIKGKDYNIIIDAGFGIQKLDKYCDFSNKNYLFISHLHLDHICGLHLLAKFNFKYGLDIFIKQGLKNKLNRILSLDYTVPINHLNYKAKIIELNNNLKLPFKLKYLPLKHSVPTLGFRFEIEDKIITFISDTGYCENAVKLAKDSDILITECSYLSGEINENWPHLNPELAKRIVIESNSKKLILTHFAADKYTDLKQRKINI